jgi:hypothetical protein
MTGGIADERVRLPVDDERATGASARAATDHTLCSPPCANSCRVPSGRAISRCPFRTPRSFTPVLHSIVSDTSTSMLASAPRSSVALIQIA